MGYDVFICYRRNGSGFLPQALRDRLEERGYRVFMDMESMQGGTFNTQIYQVLGECNDVVVVLPPQALDRCSDPEDWVRREIEFAFKNNKRIIPLMMRNFEFPPVLPPEMDALRNQQGVSAEPEFFDAVIDRLCGYMISRPHRKQLFPHRQKSISTAEKKPEHTIGTIGTLFHSLNQVAVGMYVVLLLLGGLVFLLEPVRNYFSTSMLTVTAVIMIAAVVGLIVSLRALSVGKVELSDFTDIGPEYLDGSFGKLIDQLVCLDGEHLIGAFSGKADEVEQEKEYTSIRRFKGVTVATNAENRVDYIRWVPAEAPKLSFFYTGYDMVYRDVVKNLKYLPFEFVASEQQSLVFTYHEIQLTFLFAPNRYLPLSSLRQLESVTAQRVTTS